MDDKNNNRNAPLHAVGTSNKVRNITIVVVIIGILTACLYSFLSQEPEPEPVPEPAPVQEAPTVDMIYPTDKLFVTSEREAYESGDMILEVPRLDFSGPVMDGVDDVTLMDGVGLFDYAQLPGEGNYNVSIAGHRDVYGYEFYDIDKMTDGDLMYLTYKGNRYTYRYMMTDIVEEDDWTYIYSTEIPHITLMSCHPISVASKRMFVTGELIDTEPVEN